jgi:high-affinity iron transporter
MLGALVIVFREVIEAISVLGRRLWDSSGVLPQDGMLGRLLHTLIGYTDRPTELQLLVYLATLALMAALAWVATPARSPRTAV